MITGIDPNQTTDFVAKGDDPENPTVFVIGVFTKRQKLLIESMSNDSIPAIELVSIGLKKIKNMVNPSNGEAQDFDKIDEDVINMIPDEVFVEIIEEIGKVNSVGVETEKN